MVEWLGNSEAVARKHYPQVTDDHYRRAAGMPGGESPEAAKTGPKRSLSTSQNGDARTRTKRVNPEKNAYLSAN